MNRSAVPVRWPSSSSRSTICAWMVTSSAVVGSSAISSRGSHTSAIAIITRWRMPPDRLIGYIVDAVARRWDADRRQRLDGALARLACARP